MSENKICCIFNLAPHYRSSIYTLMDKELSCDFYFGDKVESKMKIMDIQQLNGYKKTVLNKRIIFKRYWWQKGVVHLVFKKQYKYFILTGDSSILSSWLIILFCLILRKKTFIWMHGLQSEPSWKGKLITYPFYWMASKFLLYGEHAKQVMIKLGFSEKKIECIYNSLDYEHQLLIREKLQKTDIYSDFFGNNLPTLIYIGRIQKVKKIEQLFEAIRLLEERKLYCNLMLIGENTDDIDLDKLHAQNNLQSKFWYYGPCYDENIIGDFIYNAEVCVSPGNIGLTAIHSLSYGTPCITHNNFIEQMPEYEAIQKGKTGFFFKENNIRDLSDKIEKCLSIETEKREEVRKDCYAIIDEKYNTCYQINLLKKLLSS
jgi:glycosyltransferase involved in cell wall biosynthesis